jgi:DNA-binding transcriptional LysR family regulator
MTPVHPFVSTRIRTLVVQECTSVDWDGLQVFLVVARSGRVSAAARRLGVEHTTVARRIAALEKTLGVSLFYRTSRGYLLTPEGQNVVSTAEAMERAALVVEARARETSGPPAGRVRVAMPPEYGSHWLAPKLATFRMLHPQIELHILVGTRQRDLSRGEAELAIQPPRPTQTGMVAVRLGRAAVGLYASKNLIGTRRVRIKKFADALDWPLCTYTPPFQILQNARWFQPILASGRIALQSNSTHALLAAARAGAGIAVLPRFVAREHDDLVPVSDDVASHDILLITHPEVRRDPKVRATADFLKQLAAGPPALC